MSPSGYSGELPPPRFNLARYCLAGKPADKVALIVAGEETEFLTYGGIEDTVLRMAGGLSKLGFAPGTRIFLRMGNSPDFALWFFAATAAGLTPIPASSMLTAEDVAFLAEDAAIGGLAWDGVLDLPPLDAGVRLFRPEDTGRLKRLARGSYADTAKDDPAYMVYTSGTTSHPKGVLHAQRAVWGRRPMYQGWYGIGASDVVLHTGAFNWTYTLGTGLCDPFANGATSIVYTGGRNPGVWEPLARQHGATILASVPGIYRQLLKFGFKPPESLRHGLVAGEALAPSLLDGWREATGCELYEALGMSEISTYISSSPSVPVRRGSPGKPQSGRAITILDDGRVAVHRSDPGLMLGYWRRPDEEAEVYVGTDWFAGGDLGRFDEEGYFWYLGRANDLMNASGYRVSPLEVEAVIATHPAVHEVAVAEIRIAEDLSIIAAFVVPHAGVAADPDDILGFARNHLAAYKCPKELRLVASLPHSPNGKLIRKALTL